VRRNYTRQADLAQCSQNAPGLRKMREMTAGRLIAPTFRAAGGASPSA
jgi:hypothetical protein